MAATFSSIKHSKIHPKFLHSNSTSHRWAFGAIAELIDNAMDPDVNATQFCIDMQEFNGETCLVFMDNGYGMTPETLHKMLGFGHSDKKEVDGHRPIGFYGNGFKSGSMRLGRDALVLTKCSDSMGVGFLSQTFLKAEGLNEILVPMVTWDLDGYCLEPHSKETQDSLRAIIKYSVFKDEDSLLLQLDAIPECGTIIIISNLRRNGRQLELDFMQEKYDIRISSDEPSEAELDADGKKLSFQQSRPIQPRGVDVPLDYSLRSYVNVLYKVPRMQIFIRNKKVKSQRIISLLRNKTHETYRPRDVPPGARAEIEMGFNTENEELYGMMLYHRNRLIKPYLRVGIQQEANSKGVGVLGVVEADYLQPTHNKQNFDNTKAFRALMAKLAQMLKYYWFERVESVPRNPYGGEYALEDGSAQGAGKKPEETNDKIPDDLWVQCDFPKCLKWRRLPAKSDPSSLPDIWFCYMHPDPDVAAQSHDYPEEKYDGTEDNGNTMSIKDAKKKFDQLKREKQMQDKQKEQDTRDELQRKLQDADAARRRLEKEKQEFEAEKQRLQEEREKEREKAAIKRQEANKDADSKGVRKSSELGFGSEDLGLPTDWDSAAGGLEQMQGGPADMNNFLMRAGEKPNKGDAGPGHPGRDADQRREQQQQQVVGGKRDRVGADTSQQPPPSRESGPPPSMQPPMGDHRGRAPEERMMQGVMGPGSAEDVRYQQLSSQMLMTCKKLRHCLLTMSHLAGAEDDTQALLNLSPADLQALNTNVLCDKFKMVISQRMDGGPPR